MREELLTGATLFRDMTADEVHSALHCLDAKEKHYSANEIIFHEGDAVTRAGIVLSGSVLILQEDVYGSRDIRSVLHAPELFAETFACAGIERFPVTVLAAEPSDVMLIDFRRIFTTCPNACPHHSRLMANTVRLMAEKTLRLNGKLEIITRRTTRDKLLAYLSSVAKQCRSDTFDIPYNRQQLSDFLCVERSALSAEIGKLRREGLIDADRSRFTLHLP